MILWVSDSDSTMEMAYLGSTVSDNSAGRLENWRLKSPESSFTLVWALRELSDGTPTHGLSTWPGLPHNMVTTFHGLAWLKLRQRPWHYDASLKVISAMESRWSGRRISERVKNGSEGNRRQPLLPRTCRENSTTSPPCHICVLHRNQCIRKL